MKLIINIKEVENGFTINTNLFKETWYPNTRTVVAKNQKELVDIIHDIIKDKDKLNMTRV